MDERLLSLVMRAMRFLLQESPCWIEEFFPVYWMRDDELQSKMAANLYAQHLRSLASGHLQESALFGLGYALAHLSTIPELERIGVLERYIKEAEHQFPEPYYSVDF